MIAHLPRLTFALAICLGLTGTAATAAQPVPNLVGHIAQPLRYRPDHGDFVIHNGSEFFNRSLYGGHTAFRVDGGDKPEFVLYLPGRGGNLRLGVATAAGITWLKDAADVTTRYRPGELIYEVGDPAFGAVTVEALAYADTEGLIVRVTAAQIKDGARLVWAYGGVNGQRGSRDGDIGTEKVPISQYFQFQPAFAAGNIVTTDTHGFTLKSAAATIAGIVPDGAIQTIADGADWDHLDKLFTGSATPAAPIVTGQAALRAGQPLLLSLQKIAGAQSGDLDTYSEVGAKAATSAATPLLPVFSPDSLPQHFAATEAYFDALRNRVRIDTPDPYLNAAMGALNVATDALWDDQQHAIMHGAIAWRTKLLGWRGPYALDDLGWHDRARQNFDTWLPGQNTDPIAAIPPADSASNLARNEAGLHSNGDLSHSHYDMNLVFIDALLRHLDWTGDAAYARQVWPQLKRHLAWEKRLFRRTFGPQHLPLYEAYADIWASDDLYYSGGGTAVASAYNAYANRAAARIAALTGDDPRPYAREADLIDKAMHSLLWLPDQGAFAENKDLLGLQRVHPDYALWSFYHPIDEDTATPVEAWHMGEDLARHLKPIPVTGPGVPDDRPYHVLSESDWMPYTWSVNNVVMDENLHTALALWQGEHAEDAYDVAKGAILASMFMGISPGNVGTMDYLDVYRRESQRDFGDSAGTLSRAVIEGLFGVRPDAMAGRLTIAPSLPEKWNSARLTHPDVTMHFERNGRSDRWEFTADRRFHTLLLHLPAAFSKVASVHVNGAPIAWHNDPNAVGRPRLRLSISARGPVKVDIQWAGQPLSFTAPYRVPGAYDEGPLRPKTAGDFRWLSPIPLPAPPAVAVPPLADWLHTPVAAQDTVDLTPYFNDNVTNLFAPGKYQSPRAPGVSLSLPSQGIGAWAGSLNTLPKIDDAGLRQVSGDNGGRLLLPNGIALATPAQAGARNIVFTSQWDNYPHTVDIPLNGQAKRIVLLMAGSTNAMQSHIDNGEVIVTYADNSQARLALRNPETWWPIEQDYFIDDYQFTDDAERPPRIDLKTGKFRLLDGTGFKGQGHTIDGGAATILTLPLDPAKPLKSLTVRTLSNDVVVGLMSATLVR